MQAGRLFVLLLHFMRERKGYSVAKNVGDNKKRGFLSLFKRGKKPKKPKVSKKTVDLLPFVCPEDGYILLKDGTWMEIMQIETTDLYSKNEEELLRLLRMQTMFLRTFNESFKEVIMNFPIDATTQRNYWLKKKKNVKDPVLLKFIDVKLHEFDVLERERMNREFFLFLFADTKERLTTSVLQVIRSRQHAFPVQKISQSKKRDVLFLLNNQNTKLNRE